MWYLYLDESGDLGFDFENKNPSKYFIICILLIKDRNCLKRITKAVQKTLYKKLKKPKKSFQWELKGSNIRFEIKSYFWKQIKDCEFQIFSITLKKKDFKEIHNAQKERIYNYLAYKLIEAIPFEEATDRIQIIVDRSKSKHEIEMFNRGVFSQLLGRVDLRIPVSIDHVSSEIDYPLQAVDLFTWGVFRKHESNDLEWYNLFKGKVKYDETYK